MVSFDICNRYHLVGKCFDWLVGVLIRYRVRSLKWRIMFRFRKPRQEDTREEKKTLINLNAKYLMQELHGLSSVQLPVSLHHPQKSLGSTAESFLTNTVHFVLLNFNKKTNQIHILSRLTQIIQMYLLKQVLAWQHPELTPYSAVLALITFVQVHENPQPQKQNMHLQ